MSIANKPSRPEQRIKGVQKLGLFQITCYVSLAYKVEQKFVFLCLLLFLLLFFCHSVILPFLSKITCSHIFHNHYKEHVTIHPLPVSTCEPSPADPIITVCGEGQPPPFQKG